MNQTILITGASSGFGLMLATQLHEAGHTVIGTSRNPELYQRKVPFELLALDIADDASIDAFTKQLFGQIQTLDVLINNAGYMLTGLAEETPIELGQKQFDTNFWGTVKITNALLPHFRKQKQGKIITTSSIVGLIGPPNLSYYAASKHALEGYFKALRFELNQFNIKVSMVEPIWFKTNISHNSVSSPVRIADYDQFRNQVETYTKKSIDEAEGPEAVVRTITKLIDSKEPKLSNPVGKMTGMILFLQSYAHKMFEESILKSVRTA